MAARLAARSPSRSRKDPTTHAQVGSVWGRLTVLSHTTSRSAITGRLQRLVRCACTCGDQTDVKLENLRSGNTRSCGCIARESARELCGRRRGPRRRLLDELARHLTPEQMAGFVVRVEADAVVVTFPARRPV